jgi:hypothetical protein
LVIVCSLQFDNDPTAWSHFLGKWVKLKMPPEIDGGIQLNWGMDEARRVVDYHQCVSFEKAEAGEKVR